MTLKNTGMQKMLNGFLRYRAKLRNELLDEFKTTANNLNPQSILVTCIDSRILSSRIIQASPGNVIISRNPGNLIPNYQELEKHTPRVEEASLELACVHNHVNTVVGCGHSDCKAMNLVYESRKEKFIPNNPNDGVLKRWLMLNTQKTIRNFTELEKSNFNKPITIKLADNIQFDAFIDPEDKFEMNDKFSMTNALTQLENLQRFKFLADPIKHKKTSVYAMWLDIYTGDVYVFSQKEKTFVKLDDESYEEVSKSLSY